MAQQFKSIYFADFPGTTAKQRNLKLAFGPSDEPLYRVLRPLSSHQLRSLLGAGNFAELKAASENQEESLNAFCLNRLREAAGASSVANPEVDDSDHQADVLDPLQATFRGGKDEPLHDWYPYLEGYSPEFVQRLLLRYASDAQRICDPFAGTGTTPLTVAGLGRRAYYCELNPLLQFLIEVKSLAYSLNSEQRFEVFGELKLLAATLGDRLQSAAPDRLLDWAFRRVFGDSQFFEPEVYGDVLRMRTLLDELACSGFAVARLASIAAISSLVPSSLLIRRGDLRFKNAAERRRPVPTLVAVMARQLDRMAHDLLRIAPLTPPPEFICADARTLAKVPPLELDAVITSPPYLNGTNYFRNTKVELWFLRCLSTADDLAGFRLRAVTSGINDVTVDKPTRSPTTAIGELVRNLEDRAYDSRIPRMVQTYFHDMAGVFDGLAKHLTSRAPVLIDLGNSAYGGVVVDTPKLLVEMLSERGFRLDREVVLRPRASRGGEALHQVLLVLQAPARRGAPRRMSGRQEWSATWSSFKRDLPHQVGDCAKRNWGHSLHSLCSYQGKMKPSLAAALIESFAGSCAKVLDPFGGVGTIPFEGALHGNESWSFDISPAAVHIATAKLRRPAAKECECVLQELENEIHARPASAVERAEAESIRFNGVLPTYFHPDTFGEILVARQFFQERSPSTDAASMVLACLLHVLHGNRPYALSRRSHPITPFAPTGRAEYRGLIDRVGEKLRRSLVEPLPAGFVRGKSVFQDATDPWPQDVDALDAVITSPPFFDSTRFYLANWMRLWFCGWSSADFKERPKAFVDERQKRSFEVYAAVFRQARERLKPGGVMVLHLGKSRKCDMSAHLQSLARRWFRVADTFNECVAHCESHGIRDKGTVVEHSYLVLE